jgi:hypothetical protein
MTKSEQWQQHLNHWRDSGLSQIEFCKQQNIAVHNLQYWRKRLLPKPDKSTAMIPVSVRQAVPARLRLGPQVIIELPTEALPDVLLTLHNRGLLYAST